MRLGDAKKEHLTSTLNEIKICEKRNMTFVFKVHLSRFLGPDN